MADLSNVVEYDRLHEIAIKNTLTLEDTGVKVYVVSEDSQRVTSALRKLQADIWDRMRKGEMLDPAEAGFERDRVILIASVDSWDWGEHEFAGISGAGKASVEDATKLVDHPNSKWIVDQIRAGVDTIANFMQKSQPSAPTGSSEK